VRYGGPISMAAAIRVRKSQGNVIVTDPDFDKADAAARSIESAAWGDPKRDEPHPFGRDGVRNLHPAPHYQTNRKLGHSFFNWPGALCVLVVPPAGNGNVEVFPIGPIVKPTTGDDGIKPDGTATAGMLVITFGAEYFAADAVWSGIGGMIRGFPAVLQNLKDSIQSYPAAPQLPSLQN
jgi:hypothetical protein